MAGVFIGEVPVLENVRAADKTYLMKLRAPEVSKGKAGQFVMVRCGSRPEMGGGPLLKRPFSVHGFGADGSISLLYRVTGFGTGLLSGVKSGDRVEVMGPLGRGFKIPAEAGLVYLVAGGIGLAPFLALSEALPQSAKAVLFYGVRHGSELLDEPYLKNIRAEAMVACEDGTVGRRGLVTELLAEALEKEPAPIFACGPKLMLAATASLAARSGVDCQVSLEAHMACGMGACLGCVVEARGSEPSKPTYTRVCLEGPVYRAEEVRW